MESSINTCYVTEKVNFGNWHQSVGCM